MSHSGDDRPVERAARSFNGARGTSEPHVLRKHPDLNMTLAKYLLSSRDGSDDEIVPLEKFLL